MPYVIGAVVAAFVVILTLLKAYLHRITVFEFERGLKYEHGCYAGVLMAGEHWYWSWGTYISKVDIRPRFLTIAGQELLSSDGVALKVSLAANYEVAEPDIAVNKVQNYEQALYVELQLALRQIVGEADIDTVLTERGDFAKKLVTLVEAKAQTLGLRLISVDVKDIMFPGKLKETFAQVVNARKEGLAALERARGETAALRNLANAAKMIESNPALMQLRLVQAVGGGSGNTLILGMPSQTTVVPINVKEGGGAGGPALPGGPPSEGA
jgi:regulator of protease activity HflC (stomatin/prohibitin superfamily)